MTNAIDNAPQIVADILAGNANAETRLVQEYERGLLFILRRACNNDQELAADLVQDTWQIVITKIRAQELKDPSKLASFIIQIGKNLAIAHYRKASVQRTESLEQFDRAEQTDQADNPEDILLRHNQAMMVKTVVRSLDKKRDRDIMFRLFVKGQDKSLICQELKLDKNHFDRVLYRAKQRFRKLWITYEDST